MRRSAIAVEARVMTAVFEDPVSEVAWSPGGDWLAAVSCTGQVAVLAPDGSPPIRLGAVAGPRCLSWAPDGGALAVGGVEGTVELVAMPGGRRLWKRGVWGRPRVIGWSAAGGLLAVATSWKVAFLLPDGGCWSTAVVPEGTASALDWCRHSDLLAIGGARGALICDPLSGSASGPVIAPGHRVGDTAFSPAGGTLAAAHLDGCIDICTLATGEITRLMGQGRQVCLAWRADGARLAIGSSTGVCVWPFTGRALHPEPVWEDRSGPGSNVAYQPGGFLLGVLAGDGRLLLAAPDDQATVATVTLDSAVETIAWHPAAGGLAAGTADGTVGFLDFS